MGILQSLPPGYYSSELMELDFSDRFFSLVLPGAVPQSRSLRKHSPSLSTLALCQMAVALPQMNRNDPEKRYRILCSKTLDSQVNYPHFCLYICYSSDLLQMMWYCFHILGSSYLWEVWWWPWPLFPSALLLIVTLCFESPLYIYIYYVTHWMAVVSLFPLLIYIYLTLYLDVCSFFLSFCPEFYYEV